MLEYTLYDRFPNSGYILNASKTLPAECKEQVERICSAIVDPQDSCHSFAIRLVPINGYIYLSIIHRIPAGCDEQRGHNRIVTYIFDDESANANFVMGFRTILFRLLKASHEAIPPILQEACTPSSDRLLTMIAGGIFYHEHDTQLFAETSASDSIALLEIVWDMVPYHLRKKLSFCLGLRSGSEAVGCVLNFTDDLTQIDWELAGKTNKFYCASDGSIHSAGRYDSNCMVDGKRAIAVMKALPCKELFMRGIFTFDDFHILTAHVNPDSIDRCMLMHALGLMDIDNISHALSKANLSETELELLLLCSHGIPALKRKILQMVYPENHVEIEEDITADVCEDPQMDEEPTARPPLKSSRKTLSERLKEQWNQYLRITVILEMILVSIVLLLSLLGANGTSTERLVYIVIDLNDIYLLLKVLSLMILSFFIGLIIRK